MRFFYLLFSLFLFASSLDAQVFVDSGQQYEKTCLIDYISADTQVQFWRFILINSGDFFDKTFDFSSGYTVSGNVTSCLCQTNNADSIEPEGYFRDPEDAFFAGVAYKEYFFAAALNDMGMVGGTVIQQIYFQ